MIKHDYDFILSFKKLNTNFPYEKDFLLLANTNAFKNNNNNRLKDFIEKSDLLVSCENAWRPKVNVDDNEKIIKIVKGLLNKLSPDNFEKLSLELYELEIDNLPLVKEVIKSIFDKALLEPNFSKLYSNLCVKMSNKNYKEKLESNNIIKEGEIINFRGYLLNQCQKEFEYFSNIKDNKENDLGKYKRRMIGNIKFIGELFNNDIISVKIIFQCIETLYKNIINLSEMQDKELAIESICNFLTTVGPKIDIENFKNVIDFYFDKLNIISNDKTFTFRFRFMIKDLLDLKNNNWTSKSKK